MNTMQINCGFIPLVDCVPLVIAKEIGFAREEGISLALHKEPNWSSLRDKLVFGQFDAAHMLSPVPVATSMGLGGIPKRLDVLSVLSINGNVIGVTSELNKKLIDLGAPSDFKSATDIGKCLIAAQSEPLRIVGLPAPGALAVHTVPPNMMVEAMAAGEIDAFCVGEPWGSVTAAKAGAALILPGQAIWSFSPEKVLAVRHDWTHSNKDTAHALLRSVWRAANWLSKPDNMLAASEILAQPAYLNVSSDVIDAAMTGHIGLTTKGITHKTERFVEFFDSAATFPWKSQGAWIASRLASRMGLDQEEAIKIGKASFRSDLYRDALDPIGVDLPGASEKVEGALQESTAVSSTLGRMILGPDRFFDNYTFDPDQY